MHLASAVIGSHLRAIVIDGRVLDERHEQVTFAQRLVDLVLQVSVVQQPMRILGDRVGRQAPQTTEQIGGPAELDRKSLAAARHRVEMVTAGCLSLARTTAVVLENILCCVVLLAVRTPEQSSCSDVLVSVEIVGSLSSISFEFD